MSRCTSRYVANNTRCDLDEGHAGDHKHQWWDGHGHPLSTTRWRNTRSEDQATYDAIAKRYDTDWQAKYLALRAACEAFFALPDPIEEGGVDEALNRIRELLK